jgi:hypothetical protein
LVSSPRAPTTSVLRRGRIAEDDWDAAEFESDEENPEGWDWLPGTHMEPDPIHRPPLSEVARDQGREQQRLEATRELYQAALVSLRGAMEHPGLKLGPSDMNPAARGAALYAVRMAVGEIVTEREGFWCSLIPLFQAGFWPCGLSDRGRVVVL